MPQIGVIQLQLGWLVRSLIATLVALALSACSASLDSSHLLDRKLERKTSPQTKQERLRDYVANADAHDGGVSDERRPAGLVKYGNDRFLGDASAPAGGDAANVISDDAEDIRLNLVDVPVSAAAKSVLGDVLELNYSVDARVQGTVTLQTSKPVSPRGLLGLFEGALRDIGAGIIGDGKSYRIVPLAEASRSLVPIQQAGDDNGQIGQRPQIISLQYVSADEIREVIEPLVPPGMIVRVDDRRNAIILNGSAAEIAAIQETIAVFDVDWMKGMSFALVSVRSTDPGAIVNDLEQIYDTKRGPLRNIVRFVPNRRLKSVLIISSRSKYLKEATNWIKKLDALASTNEQGLHVYRVQNRTAAELAKVLQSVLKGDTAGQNTGSVEAEVAPKLEDQRTQVAAAESQPTDQQQAEANGEPVAGPETPTSGLGSESEQGGAVSSSGGGVTEVASKNVRIVADDANNSLLVFATDAEYQRILAVLEEVDSQPNQVLLEAVIAEVTLDDELKFGVRWLIGDKGNDNGTFSDLASGAVASSFPGFSYFLRANDVSFTLNALASVTDVRVLSSPSLVVLDNKTAVLQVGDQVPIVTQTSQGTQGGNAPIVSNVDLKDTGIILTVTPRVNDSGRVTLDVEQEVSDVVRTVTSGINSPTIQQRRIKTSVVVTDGEALALGGLIQEKESTGKSKVPVLGDVPLLGNAFRQKTNRINRTELIIFIRPRVIRDMDEARRVTREFRKELGVKAPRVRLGEPQAGDELLRILN